MAKPSTKLFKRKDSSTPDGIWLHILLAEDSPFQQLLIGHILKQLGHKVTVVGDGFEALSALQRDGCYDLLLVNCHLPLMDGIKATTFIRGSEGKTGKHLPIIGMSASAVPEECFRAGMDDFLRKPIQKLLLKAVLGRWLREKKGRIMESLHKGMASLLLIGALASIAWLSSIASVFAQSDSSPESSAPIKKAASIKTCALIKRAAAINTTALNKLHSGIASWYGRPFHGRRTASGQIYDMNKLTAAHPTLPLSSEVLVVNPRNGKTVVLIVTDRGPYIKNRVIDLSRAAAQRLGILSCGLAYVNYSVVSQQAQVKTKGGDRASKIN
jgi:rare lipoprotein A